MAAVPPERVRAAASDARSTALAEIHAAAWGDVAHPSDALWSVAAAADDLDAFPAVTVAGFDDLVPGQWALLRALARVAPVEVVMPFDARRAAHEARRERQRRWEAGASAGTVDDRAEGPPRLAARLFEPGRPVGRARRPAPRGHGRHGGHAASRRRGGARRRRGGRPARSGRPRRAAARRAARRAGAPARRLGRPRLDDHPDARRRGSDRPRADPPAAPGRGGARRPRGARPPARLAADALQRGRPARRQPVRGPRAAGAAHPRRVAGPVGGRGDRAGPTDGAGRPGGPAGPDRRDAGGRMGCAATL